MTAPHLPDTVTELATFQVGEALCGMDIRHIQEIILLSQYTRVPQAPAEVLGILNLRGQIVTIFDLARRIGLGESVPTEQTRVIIVNTTGGKIGLLVHRISDVVQVDLKDAEPAPANLRGIQGTFFTGVCKQERSLIGLLHLDKVLGQENNNA